MDSPINEYQKVVQEDLRNLARKEECVKAMDAKAGQKEKEGKSMKELAALVQVQMYYTRLHRKSIPYYVQCAR